MLDKLPYECPKCGSTNLLMVEYPGNHPEHYDGISEINCCDCNTRIGRWSGKELKAGECEKRYGQERQSDGSRSPYFWN